LLVYNVTEVVSHNLFRVIHCITLYIEFREKNAEALQSLYRHFNIYSHQNKLWNGRQEQMRC